MTTVSSTTAVTTAQATNLQNSSAGTNYFNQGAMAHDFFGSQAFGPSIYTASAQNKTEQQVQTTANEQEIFVLNENPQNLASYLLNEHYIMQQEKALAAAGKLKTPSATGTEQQTTTETKTAPQAMPTAQDYYIATQIANQFKNMGTFMSSNTPFTDRDYFAQSTFGTNGTSLGFNFAV